MKGLGRRLLAAATMSIHGVNHGHSAAQAQYAEWLRHLEARRLAQQGGEFRVQGRGEEGDGEPEEDILDREREQPEQEEGAAPAEDQIDSGEHRAGASDLPNRDDLPEGPGSTLRSFA